LERRDKGYSHKKGMVYYLVSLIIGEVFKTFATSQIKSLYVSVVLFYIMQFYCSA